MTKKEKRKLEKKLDLSTRRGADVHINKKESSAIQAMATQAILEERRAAREERKKEKGKKKKRVHAAFTPEESPVTRRGHARKGRAGRKSRLCIELQEKMVEGFRLGLYAETVCDLVGLTFQTFTEWMHHGEQEIADGYPDGPYAQFATAIKMSRGESTRELHQTLKKRKLNWQACAWLLERTQQNRYALRQRHEFSGPDGGPIRMRHDLSKLSVEELEKLEALLAKTTEGE